MGMAGAVGRRTQRGRFTGAGNEGESEEQGTAEAAAETATLAGGPAEDLTLASDMPTESFLVGGAWCSITFFSSVVYAVVASGPSLLTLRFWIVFQN